MAATKSGSGKSSKKKKSKRGLKLIGLAFVIVAIIWLMLPVSTKSSTTSAIKAFFDAILSPSPTQSTLETECRRQGIEFPPKGVNIVIDKSDRKLYLYSAEKLIKEYQVIVGRDPLHDKVKRDDRCTPEGEFYVCEKSKKPGKELLGTRWMHLSYPNKEDAARGLKSGLIDSATSNAICRAIDKHAMPPQDTPLGGGVGIHGAGFKSDSGKVHLWTSGCVALRNADIEEFYEYTPAGTKVVIKE